MSNTMRKLMNFPVGIRTTTTATSDYDIPNKLQIAGMIAGRLNVKDSVRVIADSDISLTAGGLLTIDGVTLQAGDRVLVKGQEELSDNGIYVAANGAWSRASDADTGGELRPYTKVFARQGVVYLGHNYVLQSENAIVVGVDAQNWVHESSISTGADDIAVNEAGLVNISGANVQAIINSIDAEFTNASTSHDADIASVRGVLGTGADANLGAFTGTTIADNSTVKVALQALETAVESAETIYDNNRYESVSTALTSGVPINFAHNIGTKYLSGTKVYSASGDDITATVSIKVVDSNNLTIQNDDSTLSVVVVTAK